MNPKLIERARAAIRDRTPQAWSYGLQALAEVERLQDETPRGTDTVMCHSGHETQHALWNCPTCTDHKVEAMNRIALALQGHRLGQPVRGAESTRDPIWMVQSRRIIVFPGSGWLWCADCESYYREHTEEVLVNERSNCWDHRHDEEDPAYVEGRSPAKVLEQDSDACQETWEPVPGAIFLDREAGEAWADARAYRWSEGHRVYCYALVRESPLCDALRIAMHYIEENNIPKDA